MGLPDRSMRGSRAALHGDLHHQRNDLGAPYLEYLVDLGPAPDDSHNYGVYLYRFYAIAAGRG